MAARRNRLTLNAAGITFYAMLAAFPAAIAAISLYGLVADPVNLAIELEGFAEFLPPPAAELLIDELEVLASGPNPHIGLGAVAAIVVALWTASSALRALSVGLDQTYGVEEPRRYLLQRVISYALTFGFIVGIVAQGIVVAATPAWLRAGALAETVRWPVLYAALVTGVAVVYRVAPNRPWTEGRWAVGGSLIGGGGILAATAVISIYGRHAGNLNSTYGALAGVVLPTAVAAVLIGAEVDVALRREHPTTCVVQPVWLRD